MSDQEALLQINKNLGELNGKVDMLIELQKNDSQAQWAAINKNSEEITKVKVKAASWGGATALITSFISEIFKGNLSG